MLCEYALDPGLLNQWDAVRDILSQFGIQHGRLIAEFPKRWKKLVYEASLTRSELERSRISEKLKQLDDKLLVGTRAYDGAQPWVANALTQHTTKPFHAIISDNCTTPASHVLKRNQLNNDSPLWCVQRDALVSRTASDLTRTVEKLLYHSTEILLIE